MERELLRQGPYVVWRARHELLKCPVLVETLESDGTDEQREALVNCTKVLAQLDHANCARIEELHQLAGEVHVVYRGRLTPVSQLRGPVPGAQPLEVITGVLRALEHAHGRGIVHGLLGPQMVLLPEGDPSNVKVRGFSTRVDPADEAAFAEAVASDLRGAGEVLMRLVEAPASSTQECDEEPGPVMPRALRRLASRLQGVRAPFPSARAALDDISRNFTQAAGQLLPPGSFEDVGDYDAIPELLPHPSAGGETQPAMSASGINAGFFDPAARRMALVAIGVFVAAAVIVVSWLVVRPSSNGDAGTSTQPAAAAAPAVAAADRPALFEMLGRLNDGEAARQLNYAQRHDMLDRVRADPGMRDLVDKRLQLILDLEQASSAPQPCAAFRKALLSMVANPHPDFRAVVGKAEVPTARIEGDKACRGLQQELAEVRTALRAGGKPTR